MIRDWLQLRRRVGINPATPLPSQEGQLRYARPDGAAGVLYLALGAADDSVAWTGILPKTGGTISGDLTLGGHLRASGDAPTYTLLVPAGDTATAAVVGNDIAGQIEVVPGGTGIATGSFITVTFDAAYPGSSYTVLITPDSSAARSLTTGIGPTGRTANGFNLDTRTALTSGSTYQWGYLVIYRG